MKNIQAAPIPQGLYVSSKRCGEIIFTAGITPRVDGKLVLQGKVDNQHPLEYYRPAVRIAAKGALDAAGASLKEGEWVAQALSMTVYVNASDDFVLHSKVADFASELLAEELGEGGKSSRVAVGVQNLPGNAPVEIQLVVAVTAEKRALTE